MRFAFVEERRQHISVDRLCRMLKVTSRGYRSWRCRPISQHDGMICWLISENSIIAVLAVMPCTAGYFLRKCPESGWPRMPQELKEVGLTVGHRRVGRLMRDNGIRAVRTRKYKATTFARQAIAKQSAKRGIAIIASTLHPIGWIGISMRIALTRNALS